jgi:hypothetical protein
MALHVGMDAGGTRSHPRRAAPEDRRPGRVRMAGAPARAAAWLAKIW